MEWSDANQPLVIGLIPSRHETPPMDGFLFPKIVAYPLDYVGNETRAMAGIMGFMQDFKEATGEFPKMIHLYMTGGLTPILTATLNAIIRLNREDGHALELRLFHYNRDTNRYKSQYMEVF